MLSAEFMVCAHHVSLVGVACQGSVHSGVQTFLLQGAFAFWVYKVAGNKARKKSHNTALRYWNCAGCAAACCGTNALYYFCRGHIHPVVLFLQQYCSMGLIASVMDSRTPQNWSMCWCICWNQATGSAAQGHCHWHMHMLVSLQF